jgi:hypothetical protein
MPQPNPLELAKQGDVKAIAFLINRSLKAKEIQAQVNLKDGCLVVVLESATIPDKQALSQFVLNGISKLGADSIHKLRIYGRQAGSSKSAWSQEFSLKEQEKPETPEPKGTSKYLTEKEPFMPFWIAAGICINLSVVLLLFFAFKLSPKVASVPQAAPPPVEVSPPPVIEQATPSPDEDAIKEKLRETEVNVAALNAEFAAYNVIGASDGLGLSLEKVLAVVNAKMDQVLMRHPAYTRNTAKKEAIDQVVKMLEFAEKEDATAAAKHIETRYRKAKNDYGLMITEKIKID